MIASLAMSIKTLSVWLASRIRKAERVLQRGRRGVVLQLVLEEFDVELVGIVVVSGLLFGVAEGSILNERSLFT